MSSVSDVVDYTTRKMVELGVMNEAGLNIGGCTAIDSNKDEG